MSMQSAGLAGIKKELQLLTPQKLVSLCISLAKYKKDNKEYLSYLLFASDNRQEFVNEVKEEVDLLFSELDPGINLYYIKKTLRKILRLINRYSRYMGDKAHSAELYIYFLRKIKSSGIPFKKSQQIVNLYEQQLKKISSLVSALHEDLQGDYRNDIAELTSY